MNRRFRRLTASLAFLVLLLGCGPTQPNERELSADSAGETEMTPASPTAETDSRDLPDGLDSDPVGEQGDRVSDAQTVPSKETVTPKKVLDTSGAQTPQACYVAYKAALNNKDEGAKIDCLAEPDRSLWVGWYAYYLDREILFARKNADAAAKLLKRHGVEPGRVLYYINQSSNASLQPLEEMLSRVGKKLEDRTSFVVDASKLVTVRFQPNIGTAKSQLTELQIDGLSAQATVSEPGSDIDQPIYFTKESGSWLIRKRNQRVLSNLMEPEEESPAGL